MLSDTDNGMVIDSSALPFFAEVKSLIEQGFIPGGLSRNRDYRQGMVKFAAKVPEYLQHLLFDPQTSGGLLIAVAPNKASGLVKALDAAGVVNAAVVGEVVGKPQGKILVW
jgi:selenide,water dikinase